MRKHPSTFCVNVRPWPQLDIHTWGPSFWTRTILGNWAQGPSGVLVKEQGSYNPVQNMGHKGSVLRPRCIGPIGAWTHTTFIHSFIHELIGGFWLVKRFVIFCSMILAIFSLPEEFMCSPCHVNSFLVRFVSIILTWCISFNNLCSFLLKICISLFTQEESWRSYLCGGVIAMIFVCLFRSANFLMCLRPVLDSFLLMSFVPPQNTNKCQTFPLSSTQAILGK
jgi:hypothetical protein